MKNRKITITIQTGNEEMQTDHEIAKALRNLALRIDSRGFDFVSKVMDQNGNSVGTVVIEQN